METHPIQLASDPKHLFATFLSPFGAIFLPKLVQQILQQLAVRYRVN